jgi:hypothetical protein
MSAIDWLLASEPAIRWQTMRDLTDADAATLATERARVVHEGLGAAVLAQQGEDGAWHKAGEADWIPTLYSPLLLRATGADPAAPAVASAIARLAAGFHWHESLGGKPFFDGETEPCINGGTLAIGGSFGRPSHSLAQRLLGEQLPDGGWNCDAPRSTRSSFHTTICVLEGLLAYERATDALPELTEARRRGEDYLLERRMFRRRSTGEVAHPSFVTFAFPPRYHYDVLRSLDYFREAGLAPDPRVDEAVAVIRERRQPDGTWLLDASHAETVDLDFNEQVGAPSRWNTLRALRVLRWYESARV